MNISEKTIETLKGMGYNFFFNDEFFNEVEHSKAVEIYIGFARIGEGQDDIEYIGKTIKATKKEMTIDYIMDKISSDKVYKNFSSEFNKVIKKFGLCAYPTTYGIGIWNIFTLNDSELKKKIENALNTIGVLYSTEYSDARWVFRYKISKSTKNIEILKSFKVN